MYVLRRSIHNPFLVPTSEEPWQALGTFNWCPVKDGKTIHCLYRAVSAPETIHDIHGEFSSVGYTKSTDGVHFDERRQLIYPEYEWEVYGCEDPRITEIDGTYYIFYTALSNYPFSSAGIRVALAKTRDFKTIDEKHLVTPFNAKAMTLFPERIGGKLTAILTVNTDQPPAKIAIAQFENEEQMLDAAHWQKWYAELDQHTIDDPRRSNVDHVEVGATPIRVKEGWLLIYSHIQNYFHSDANAKRVFGIEALLLDAKDPRKIIAHTEGPILTPVEEYEVYGHIPNIVFPSGALVEDGVLTIYYGGADTVSCRASVNLANLLFSMKPHVIDTYVKRYEKNPILSPRPDHAWEAKAVFNPGVVELGGEIHLFYRAMGNDDTSVMGYAKTKDGFTITERSDEPAYVPRLAFEQKTHPGNSGCEDARLTVIGERVYMCYTAYDGSAPPRVAATSISVSDFLAKRWSAWELPVLISPKNLDDKDACIFPEKINGKYLVLHRIAGDICAEYIPSLSFTPDMLKNGTAIVSPRSDMWDSIRIGISAPPIKTPDGWLLFYHGISPNTHTYRVGALLLDKKDPTIVTARSTVPFFEPLLPYEKVGQINNVVFPCGAVNRKGTIYLYYGAADSVVGVATIPLQKVLDSFR